jgi:hypothetical protein
MDPSGAKRLAQQLSSSAAYQLNSGAEGAMRRLPFDAVYGTQAELGAEFRVQRFGVPGSEVQRFRVPDSRQKMSKSQAPNSKQIRNLKQGIN